MRIRFIFLSFLLSPIISNAQKMSIETTLAKASKDWKKLEAMFGSSTITYIKKEPYIPGNPPINVYGKIYSTGESICESSLAPENFREPNKNLRNRVTCSNSDYSFIIGKKENATSFVASFIGKEGEKFSQQLASTKVTRGIMTYVMGKSMLTWLNDPEFTIHTIEATSENGQNLVRFDCSRLTSDKDEKSA